MNNPHHPIWGILLLAVFALIRLGFANTIDGDEMRDLLIVAGFVGRDFMSRKSNDSE